MWLALGGTWRLSRTGLDTVAGSGTRGCGSRPRLPHHGGWYKAWVPASRGPAMLTAFLLLLLLLLGLGLGLGRQRGALPGPLALPLLGHLPHLLHPHLPQHLLHLAQQHGPLYCLHLGSRGESALGPPTLPWTFPDLGTLQTLPKPARVPPMGSPSLGDPQPGLHCPPHGPSQPWGCNQDPTMESPSLRDIQPDIPPSPWGHPQATRVPPWDPPKPGSPPHYGPYQAWGSPPETPLNQPTPMRSPSLGRLPHSQPLPHGVFQMWGPPQPPTSHKGI